jgi:SNF2 family DNA or RNA helicase
MIIIPNRKALVLKLREPSRVTNVIPTAKLLSLQGQPIVAVPHRLDEARVLRNLGFNCPSPIRYFYDWPGRFKPFAAQRDTAEFLTLQGNAFVLNDLGTGKTLAALWAYDYLRMVKHVHKALIISPLSTLERTWGDEVFKNFPHLRFHVLHGQRGKRLKLLAEDVDLYLINHDGVKTKGFLEELEQRPDIDLVIIDEIAQVARNAGADRWKVLNKICNKQHPRRVWGMTGTPTPNTPTDAWAQCRLLVPSSVPPYFNRFKDMVMKQVSSFTWIPRPDAIETVYKVMQPAVRFNREDCVDLPPTVYQTRSVIMSPAQGKAYKEMVSKLRAEVEGGEVLAVNEAVKLAKLLQLACGAAYGPDGSVIDIEVGQRMDVLQEIVEEAGTKVIVFVPFVAAVEKVATELARRIAPSTVETIHGGTSATKRAEVFKSFQDFDEPRVLVAQPAAMSHGLTLTAANTIVWYSAITSNETYQQANGRITRPGQQHTQFIINIEGSPVERKLYDRLKDRQSMQGLLVEMVRGNKTIEVAA